MKPQLERDGAEKLEKPSFSEMEIKVVEKLKAYFENCEYSSLSGGKLIKINLPIEDEGEKLVCLELLDLVGILAWDEKRGIQIDGKHDIAKLRLLGLVDETYFVYLENEGNDEYNPYAFPLEYQKNQLGTFNKISKFDRSFSNEERREEERPEMVEDLQNIVENFDRGKSGGEKALPASPFRDIGFLYRLSKRYSWHSGKVFDGKEEREIGEEELTELETKAQDGNEKAMDTLLRVHMGLVYFVFNNFRRFFPINDPDNILQAGALGLKQAISTHNPAKGKFSTHAVIWIENYVRRAWRDSGPIRVPSRVFERRNAYHLIDKKALSPEERKQKLNTLAQSFGFSSVEEMEDICIIGDKFIGVDDETLSEASVHEYSAQPNQKKLEEGIIEKKLRENVEEVLATLTPRESIILRWIFFHDLSLEEIGFRFDVTGESVRQVEAKALRKLRHPAKSGRLRDFLEETYKEIKFPAVIHIDGKDIEVQKLINLKNNPDKRQGKTPKELAEEYGISEGLVNVICDMDFFSLNKIIYDNYRQYRFSEKEGHGSTAEDTKLAE